MFAGDRINLTENRAVLHTALRAPKGSVIMFDGVNVVPEVHGVLEKWLCLQTASGMVNGKAIQAWPSGIS